jgi:hypothetical protein
MEGGIFDLNACMARRKWSILLVNYGWPGTMGNLKRDVFYCIGRSILGYGMNE